MPEQEFATPARATDRGSLRIWKLKNRIHAVALILSLIFSVAYIVQQHLVWSAGWKFLVVMLVHQHLMTVTHRLLFHKPKGVTWRSPILTFLLRNWMVFFWSEGFECVRAAHDTTQLSQKNEHRCLSETMLWFSPKYMAINRSDFVTPSYLVRHTALQLAVYSGAWAAWGFVSQDLRLWALLVLFVVPVVSRVMFFLGHAFLHTPEESLLFTKAQNHVSKSYERLAFNLYVRRSRFLSRYALGFLYLGDHLHNNHHHDPDALCQGGSPSELDGAYLYTRLLERLGLLTIHRSS